MSCKLPPIPYHYQSSHNLKFRIKANLKRQDSPGLPLVQALMAAVSDTTLDARWPQKTPNADLSSKQKPQRADAKFYVSIYLPIHLFVDACAFIYI